MPIFSDISEIETIHEESENDGESDCGDGEFKRKVSKRSKVKVGAASNTNPDKMGMDPTPLAMIDDMDAATLASASDDAHQQEARLAAAVAAGDVMTHLAADDNTVADVAEIPFCDDDDSDDNDGVEGGKQKRVKTIGDNLDDDDDDDEREQAQESKVSVVFILIVMLSKLQIEINLFVLHLIKTQ